MKFGVWAAVFLAVTLSFGFTWFQPKQEEKKNSPSDTIQSKVQDPAPHVPLPAITGASSYPAEQKSENVVEKSSPVKESVDSGNQSASNGQNYKGPGALPFSSAARSAVNLPVAQRDISPLKDLEIVKIQKQINDIMQANEKFKSLQQSQADQIRQITEQAQLHRRMLRDLEEKNKSSQKLKMADVDEILRQEKMRIIENETEKNKLLLDKLASQQQENSGTTP